MTRRKKTLNTSEAMEIIFKEHGDWLKLTAAEELERDFAEIEEDYPDEAPSIIEMLCGVVCGSYRLMRRL
jgi:hypothetical protein